MLDWPEYREGLKMRLDSCKAVAVLCAMLIGFQTVRASITGHAPSGWGLLGVFVLIGSFLLAVVLQLIAGWTLTILAGRTTVPFQIQFLYFVPLPKKWPAQEQTAERREFAARSLDRAAEWLGTTEYALALIGFLLLMRP